jgi:hypothetical protein
MSHFRRKRKLEDCKWIFCFSTNKKWRGIYVQCWNQVFSCRSDWYEIYFKVFRQKFPPISNLLWFLCLLILFLIMQLQIIISSYKCLLFATDIPPCILFSRNVHTRAQFIKCTWTKWGYVVFETLHSKPEGRGFDCRWCHWNFLLTILAAALWPWSRFSF